MAIQVKKAGNEEYGRWMKILLCGDPGAGKTLLSSTFPNPFYANAEGGLMSVADRHVPYADIRSSDDLFDLKVALEHDPASREALLGVKVETVVIDTLDDVQRTFIRERLTSEKRDKLTLPDFGWLNEQMQAIVRAFRNLQMNVIFVCHLKETRDEELGRIVYKPNLQGAISNDMPAFVDLSLLLDARPHTVIVGNESKQVTRRFLRTYPDPQHPWVKDRSGKLASEVDVNFRDDYARLYDSIFKNVSVGNTENVEPGIISTIKKEEPKKKVEPKKAAAPAPVVGEGEYKCESCGTDFTDGDQATLSSIKLRKTLCQTCYKQAISQ